MRRAPIRIRTFILGTVLVLLVVPTLAAGAAWLIERDHQQAGTERRLNTAFGYLTSHRAEMQRPASLQGFARLLDRLDLLAQLVLVTTTPPGKSQLYVSPALGPTLKQARPARSRAAGSARRPRPRRPRRAPGPR